VYFEDLFREERGLLGNDMLFQILLCYITENAMEESFEE
jgi:hypothetical protein